MPKIDALKLLRQQRENDFIDINFVEDCALRVVAPLVDWANQEIFGKKGGTLKFSIELDGPPNAGAIVNPDDAYSPQIVVRLSMLREIYRDAFTYPLVNRMIANQTDVIKNLNDSGQFAEAYFLEYDAYPKLTMELCSSSLQDVVTGVVKKHKDAPHSDLNESDVICRFLMFELMLVWTFFHELGHVVQRHYLLKHSNNAKTDASVISVEMEFSENDGGVAAPPNPSDVASQAREIMADVDGVQMTLRYLERSKRFQYPIIYLFFCALGCMFQRFYRHYPESLEFASSSHPHPAVRDDYSQLFLVDSIIDYLVAVGGAPDRESAGIVLVYARIRASVITGLIISHRVEASREENVLPSFMSLQGPNHMEVMRKYKLKLLESILMQAERVVAELHMNSVVALKRWLQLVKRGTE